MTTVDSEGAAIVGRIYGKFSGEGPIVVAMRSLEEDKERVEYTILHDSGEYMLSVSPGKYYIFAYWDKNSNLVYDAGEPAGDYGDSETIIAPEAGVVYNIDIDIPSRGSVIDVPIGFEISAEKPEKLYSRQAGALVDLDSELFSEENGVRGFWDPKSFFRQFCGNVYFLEEYDPKKIPILFIHGATGTPKGWKYFVEHIDRSRYQPWFYYYATGARIDSLAYLLFWKLVNLQAKYQFNQLYITAHSMGGLVARSFIINHGLQFPYVKLFVSLATPWGGDKMAEYGVKQSPFIIPSWIDMQPDGDFINSLYRRKLPENVRFYMFYGYRGSRNPLRSNNDGTISLSSLLDYRIQAEAEMSYAFKEDHASIALSRAVVDQYNEILYDFNKNHTEPTGRSGGFLRIHFSQNDDADSASLPRQLVLVPKDKNKGYITTYLYKNDNGKVIGPLPPGDYSVNILSPAVKADKSYVPVTIENEQTQELTFKMIPEGEIRGCVTNIFRSEDKYAGRPDRKYRSADKEIRIQTITLKGNSVDRILSPIRTENYNIFNALFTHTDYCTDACFAFFGLPAGDYTLVINAEGFKSITKNYSVIPGEPKEFKVSELTPN